MEDEILDYFEQEFDKDTRIIAVKYFYFEPEARLYAARLKEVGIPSFISNTNVSTALALGEGGIGLHIKEKDLIEASKLIAKLDADKKKDWETTDSYKEVDLEEIRYLQAVTAAEKSRAHTLYIGVGIIIMLLILRALIRARGVGFLEVWRDAF